MKKIITLFNQDKLWTGVFKWTIIYLLFTVVATVSNMKLGNNWFEDFSKSILWPIQFIKYLLST